MGTMEQSVLMGENVLERKSVDKTVDCDAWAVLRSLPRIE
jgi:hypothetical protein